MQNQQPNLYDTAALVVYNADIFCEELTVPVKNSSWTSRLPGFSGLIDNAARFSSPFTDYTT